VIVDSYDRLPFRERDIQELPGLQERTDCQPVDKKTKMGLERLQRATRQLLFQIHITLIAGDQLA